MKELIKAFLKKNGMRKDQIIKGYFIGINLIKVKTSYKKCSNLIIICTSTGVNDWYITDITNLGGK